MTQDSRHWIAAFRSSHRRLADLVTPLLPEQLRAPSACTEWTIASVLSHLGSQTEILSLYFEAALAHSELPSHDVFQPIWDAWNARQSETQAVDCLAVNDVFAARLEMVSADPGEDGAARLRVPAAVFLRLLNGRLRDRDASHMGLTGDVRVDELRRMFPGF